MIQEKNKFNRSEFMREKHLFARQQREIFQKEFGETPKYSDFLKEETPLTQRLVTYEVSYQMSYRGRVDSFIINPVTFKVTTFQGNESEIYNRTMSMVLDSKGRNSKNHLNANTIEMIEDNININVTPRGVEESQRKPTKQEIEKLLSSRFQVTELDREITFKNKKDREGILKLDLRHFLK